MSESSRSSGPKWVLIATALLGLVAALFVAVARYYDIQTARAAAEAERR